MHITHYITGLVFYPLTIVLLDQLPVCFVCMCVYVCCVCMCVCVCVCACVCMCVRAKEFWGFGNEEYIWPPRYSTHVLALCDLGMCRVDMCLCWLPGLLYCSFVLRVSCSSMLICIFAEMLVCTKAFHGSKASLALPRALIHEPPLLPPKKAIPLVLAHLCRQYQSLKARGLVFLSTNGPVCLASLPSLLCRDSNLLFFCSCKLCRVVVLW